LAFVAVVAVAVALAGCGNLNASGGELIVRGDGSVDYGELNGRVRIDGSSTVFPIAEAVAEEFSKVSDVRVNVGFSGTGGGLERFCRGEIAVATASREIRDEEVEACASRGIEDVIELQVATDAVTVMVNPLSDFVDCLTVDQMHEIFRAGGASRWNEVDPAWPDETIHRYFPGTDSGTFDYFVEAIISDVDEEATHTGDGTFSEDDNVLIQGIAGDTHGIGYVGFAYFQEAGDELKPVAVDGGEGCVEPSIESARSGRYQPLSRPLFIYTREQSLRDKPEVLGLVQFFLDNANALSAEVGYIPMTDAALAEQLAKIEPFLPPRLGAGTRRAGQP
jgi:phosphate transport system substrate-binding protein